MIRVLKNINGRATIDTTYNHKRYVIRPKCSISLDHNGQDEQAADYLLQTYGFLVEITPQPNFQVSEPKKAISKKR